ncbi:MAG: metallophosphoesterase [Nitrospirae bacterium]|nr:MAG: metallophosphoesterase [Nitrospirota bacterium]
MDAAQFSRFLDRLGPDHLSKRLYLQTLHTAVKFGARGLHVYIENFDAVAPYLKALLKISGLWGRAVRNSTNYEVVEHTVPLARLPRAFHGFRILHLSDLHIEGIVDQGQQLRAVLSTLDYDLCVFTGDFRFLTYGDYHHTLAHMAELVKAIHCPEGMIGILGNHDFLEMVPGLEALGIRMLLNESTALSRGGDTLWVVGVDDTHWYEGDDLDRALKGIPPDAPKILLAHSPELIPEAASAQIDYYLSGHSHGGQLCLPGGIPLKTGSWCARRFVKGAWESGTVKGYTSRGVGCSLLPVRLFCHPEIVIHTLQCQD